MFAFSFSLGDAQIWKATYPGCKWCAPKLTSEPLFCSVTVKPLKRRRGYWKLRKARQTIWGRLEKREKCWWICKRIKKDNKPETSHVTSLWISTSFAEHILLPVESGAYQRRHQHWRKYPNPEWQSSLAPNRLGVTKPPPDSGTNCSDS